MAACGIGDPRVEATFVAMAREAFLESGPPADRALGRRLSRDAGSRPGLPVHRRRDRHPAGAQPEQRPPSLHAALIAAAAAQPGEDVVHVGSGVGYYTAILAELVGAAGR